MIHNGKSKHSAVAGASWSVVYNWRGIFILFPLIKNSFLDMSSNLMSFSPRLNIFKAFNTDPGIIG